MSSGQKKHRQEKRLTKSDTVYWLGGVKSGGSMAVLMAGVELIRHHERYVPLWPPSGRVYFEWFFTLVVSSVLYFGAGCLFGLVMWELFIKRRGSGGLADE